MMNLWFLYSLGGRWPSSQLILWCQRRWLQLKSKSRRQAMRRSGSLGEHKQTLLYVIYFNNMCYLQTYFINGAHCNIFLFTFKLASLGSFEVRNSFWFCKTRSRLVLSYQSHPTCISDYAFALLYVIQITETYNCCCFYLLPLKIVDTGFLGIFSY